MQGAYGIEEEYMQSSHNLYLEGGEWENISAMDTPAEMKMLMKLAVRATQELDGQAYRNYHNV